MMVSVSAGFIKIFTLNTLLESGMLCLSVCVPVHVHENVLVYANACVAMCMGYSIVPKHIVLWCMNCMKLVTSDAWCTSEQN